jgi:anti-anti-sigma regulatory factor
MDMSNVDFQIVDDRGHLTLTGKLDVFEAPALLQAARQAVAAARPIIMQVAGLERVDASIFQILLALRQDAERQGRSLQVIGAGPSLQQLGQLLGGERSLFHRDSEGVSPL